MIQTRSDQRPLVPFAAVVLAVLPAVLDQTMLAAGLPVIAGVRAGSATSRGS